MENTLSEREKEIRFEVLKEVATMKGHAVKVKALLGVINHYVDNINEIDKLLDSMIYMYGKQ